MPNRVNVEEKFYAGSEEDSRIRTNKDGSVSCFRGGVEKREYADGSVGFFYMGTEKRILPDGKEEYYLPCLVSAEYVKDKNSVEIAGLERAKIRSFSIDGRKVLGLPGVKCQDNEEGAYYDFIEERIRAGSRRKKSLRECRCMVPGKRGKLVRCPEQVVDGKTGKKVWNSCKDCPNREYKDKKYSEISLDGILADIGKDGSSLDGTLLTGSLMSEIERETRMLADLLEHLRKINPGYAEIVDMRMCGKKQSEIAESIGKSQASVNAYLKRMFPMVKEFLDSLIY